MQPAFADGELVIIEPIGDRRVRAGDVVVARHSFKNIDVIKNVHAVEDALVELRSPAGEDSRQFGRIPVTNVRGRVTANLSQRRTL